MGTFTLETGTSSWQEWLATPLRSAHRGSHRRALLIAYQFPPTGGSGVQRPAKLAKYLPQFGWTVDVLTAAHARFPWHDLTLLADLPADLSVYPVAGKEPACVAHRLTAMIERISPPAQRWLEDRVYWRLARRAARAGHGNGEYRWVESAARAATELHARSQYDAVISSGPPHFAHDVADALVRGTGVPWIADLRDPLISDFDRSPQAVALRSAAEELERRIAQRASAIITTTEALASDLAERYPHRAGVIHAVPNGFDREDIALASPHALPSDRQRDCVFIASGSFYGRRELSRILDPMQKMLANHREWQSRVRLLLVGTIDAQQRQALTGQPYAWLEMVDYVEHLRAIRLAMQATCSIVMVPDCAHGRLSIPAKTFELLAIPRHLLAVVPENSETERICAHAGACTTAPLEDEDCVYRALESIVAAHFAGQLTSEREWSRLDRFDRQHLAGRFADCLEQAHPHGRIDPTGRCAGKELDFVLARLSSRDAAFQERQSENELTVEIG